MGLVLGVMAVTFVMDIPSGHAIMGIRLARRAIAARRLEKKMATSDEAKKGDLQTAEKGGQDKGGNAEEIESPAGVRAGDDQKLSGL